MFNPKYTVTDKIVFHLTKIAASAATIENSPLIPKWEVSLRHDALLRNAHASTAIEGNPLTLGQVSELAEGRNITVSRKAKAEVLNYLGVLKTIPDLARQTFSEILILDIHKRLTVDVLERPEACGAYRKTQVVVGNKITGEVSFRPPKAEDVPRLMKDFVAWLANPDEFRNPVLEAGICHYEFVRIHPFVDGNGRASRALASLLLYKRGFDTKRFFALDDFYDSDRAEYYKALQSVKPEILDITRWLEYFTQGIMIQIDEVRKKLITLSVDIQKVKKGGQIALTERQMSIIEAINRQEKVTISDLTNIFNISRQAVLKEIQKLMKLKVIKLVSSGRTSHYVRT